MFYVGKYINRPSLHGPLGLKTSTTVEGRHSTHEVQVLTAHDPITPGLSKYFPMIYSCDLQIVLRRNIRKKVRVKLQLIKSWSTWNHQTP